MRRASQGVAELPRRAQLCEIVRAGGVKDLLMG